MSTQQKQKELLTYGYVREICDRSVPIALINLCKSFYDEYVYWIIKGDKLKEFKNSKKGKFIQGPMVIINGIKFRLYLLPKGKQSWSTESVGYCVDVDVPDNIDDTRIYIRLFCENTQSEMKGFDVLSKRFVIGWNPDNLQFNDILHFDTLCFNALIDIKSVIYKPNDNKSLTNYMAMQKMRKYVKYTWYFDDKLVEKLQNGFVDQHIYSPNFDHNNWCLMMFPDGNNERDRSGLSLTLLYIPNGVGSLKVQVTFNVFNSDIISEKHIFDKEHFDLAIRLIFESGTIMQFDEISVSLLIVDVLDENGNTIRPNEWSKYGIIDYVYCPFIDN